MGKPKSIQFGDGSEGVEITYIKSRDTIEVSGWYDHIVGTESYEITDIRQGSPNVLARGGIGDRKLFKH